MLLLTLPQHLHSWISDLGGTILRCRARWVAQRPQVSRPHRLTHLRTQLIVGLVELEDVGVLDGAKMTQEAAALSPRRSRPAQRTQALQERHLDQCLLKVQSELYWVTCLHSLLTRPMQSTPRSKHFGTNWIQSGYYPVRNRWHVAARTSPESHSQSFSLDITDSSTTCHDPNAMLHRPRSLP